MYSDYRAQRLTFVRLEHDRKGIWLTADLGRGEGIILKYEGLKNSAQVRAEFGKNKGNVTVFTDYAAFIFLDDMLQMNM